MPFSTSWPPSRSEVQAVLDRRPAGQLDRDLLRAAESTASTLTSRVRSSGRTPESAGSPSRAVSTRSRSKARVRRAVVDQGRQATTDAITQLHRRELLTCARASAWPLILAALVLLARRLRLERRRLGQHHDERPSGVPRRRPRRRHRSRRRRAVALPRGRDRRGRAATRRRVQRVQSKVRVRVESQGTTNDELWSKYRAGHRHGRSARHRRHRRHRHDRHGQQSGRCCPRSRASTPTTTT